MTRDGRRDLERVALNINARRMVGHGSPVGKVGMLEIYRIVKCTLSHRESPSWMS